MTVVPQNLGVPTGTVMWSAAPEPPLGWLLCDGRFVLASNYPVLAEYLGNSFGGDGVTFGLPNLVGRFIIGIGDPGRDRFTYEDGQNGEHLHGLFPNVTHTHGVTDPEHNHVLLGGTHVHSATSNHLHTNTTLHTHDAPLFPAHSYAAVTTCNREVYAANFGGSSSCPRDPDDIMVTLKESFNLGPWTQGKTGLTAVNLARTGVTINVNVTGVTFVENNTDITLDFSPTDITINNFGVEAGGPRPSNIALLPIIRT
jgi:microcystin-dependent protein